MMRFLITLLTVASLTANPYLPLLMAGVDTAGGGSCTTPKETQDNSGNNQNVATAASNKYVATKFTAGTTGTRCKVQLTLRRSGSATGTLRVYIFAHDSGANLPSTGSPLATSSNTIDASTLGTSYGAANFDVSVSLASGTAYWVALEKSPTSGSTFVQWEGINSGGRTAVSPDNVTYSSAVAVACDVITYE
jgi:hypothetical protein